jgi:hypothetical protein
MENMYVPSYGSSGGVTLYNIVIVVSKPNSRPTIPSDQSIVNATVTQIIPSTNNLYSIVDRPIVTGLNPSQNFAILRPKPDETSVILNFKKLPGDVSQTILIPQDANDEIKASVGTIFQSLNVDLSNQTQTNTP